MEANNYDMLEEVDWLFRKTVRKFVKERDKINVEGVMLPGFIVLKKIIRDGPTRLTDLATELDFTSGAITALCDKLEKKGLVQRNRDAEDRRIIWLEITNEGRTFIDKHHNLGVATYTVLFEGFTKEELVLQKHFYQRLIDNLEQFSATLTKIVEENEHKEQMDVQKTEQLKKNTRFISY